MDLLATLVRKHRHRSFTPEFRKALAQRECESSVSVSRLAQDNGINANMLYEWRRQLLASQLDRASQRHAMLPVTILEAEPNTRQAKLNRAYMP